MTTPDEHADETSAVEGEAAEAIELYAFLDGELDVDACTRIELRIVTDPAFAARVQRLEHALGVSANIVRDDADRLYGALKVDAIADAVMNELARVPPLAAVIPIARTERLKRRRTPLVLGTFFAAAAAAAVFFLATRTVEAPRSDVAGSSSIGRESGIASAPIYAGATPSASSPLVASSASDAPSSGGAQTVAGVVQVDDLEVGEGVSVIYSPDGEGTPAVVWVNASREGAL